MKNVFIKNKLIDEIDSNNTTFVSEFTSFLMQQDFEILELEINDSLVSYDYNSYVIDSFTDADGYNDTVTTGSTDATFDTDEYNSTGGDTLTIDLGTISGTVIKTMLYSNDTTIPANCSITYNLYDGTNTDSDFELDTINEVSSLTSSPTTLIIKLNGASTVTIGNYCLCIWKE